MITLIILLEKVFAHIASLSAQNTFPGIGVPGSKFAIFLWLVLFTVGLPSRKMVQNAFFPRKS